MTTVVFTTDLQPDSDGLAWGLIFRAGDYPDKDFAITPEELAEAAAAFEPVDTDIEHLPTVFSGKLGKLEAVRVEGDALYGGVREPSWFAEVLGPGIRKVSATWDKAKKRLIGLAYTLNPRIKDAQIVAAFAAFAGQRHSAADLKDLQIIHDLVVGQGATCTAAYTQGTNMEPEKKEVPAPDPALTAMQAKFAEMEAQLNLERYARFAAEGKQLANSYAGVALTPAQVPVAEALFARLIADDHAAATVVTFSGTDNQPVKVNRVQALQTILNANAGLKDLLGGQQIKTNDKDDARFAMGDAGKQGDGKPDEARKNNLLNLTPLGAAIAAKGEK